MDNLEEKKWAYFFLLALVMVVVQGSLFWIIRYATGGFNYFGGGLFIGWSIWATYCGYRYFCC